MDYKYEVLDKVKEMIKNLDIDEVSRIDVYVDDEYKPAVDIQINIEIKDYSS